MIGKKLSQLADEGTTSAAPDYLYGEEAGVSVAVIGPKIKSVTSLAPAAGSTLTMALNQRYLSIAIFIGGALTIALPPSPKDGQLVSVGLGTGGATTLTLTGGTVIGVATSVGPCAGFTLIYDLATTTWYRTG